jgi:hypothetical protein
MNTPHNWLNRMVAFSLILCTLVFLPPSVQAQATDRTAADLTVGSGCTYPTLAAAITAAGNGDRILIEGGVTFAENIIIDSKNLTLEGGYSGCASGLTDLTTLDGGALDHTVTLSGTSVVTLKKLNITNGNAGNGGGVYVINTSSVTLDKTDVYNNTAANGGGMYVAAPASVILTNDSDIHHNTATTIGGGVRLWGTLTGNDWNSSITDNSAPDGGGVSVPGGELQLNGSHIMRNTATDVDGRGGGIYASSSATVVIDGSSNVAANDAYQGAGIYADGSEITLYTSVIHSNEATGHGGGLYLSNNSVLSASNMSLGTAAQNANEAVNGGGIYSENSTITFTNGNVVNNVSTGLGGGLYITATGLTVTGTTFSDNIALAGGGAIYQLGGSLLQLDNDTFYDNVADSNGNMDGYGGAIYSYNSTLEVSATYLYHNTAARGGAIYQDGASAMGTINNCLITANQVTQQGGGVYKQNGAMVLFHNTITENLGGAGFSGLADEAHNNILWDNDGGGFTTPPTNHSCNIDASEFGGINLDPKFVSPGAGADYHLRASSPAVDACGGVLYTDIEGTIRPLGAGYDMGAYEYRPIVFIPVILR